MTRWRGMLVLFKMQMLVSRLVEPLEVCQYLRVFDPVLEDIYLAHCMPMYYFDTQGNTELQSSLPIAHNDTNADYGQYKDPDEDNKPAADGNNC
jgi:hypothetical protein